MEERVHGTGVRNLRYDTQFCLKCFAMVQRALCNWSIYGIEVFWQSPKVSLNDIKTLPSSHPASAGLGHEYSKRISLSPTFIAQPCCLWSSARLIFFFSTTTLPGHFLHVPHLLQAFISENLTGFTSAAVIFFEPPLLRSPTLHYLFMIVAGLYRCCSKADSVLALAGLRT
jgi:hypothetical protein